MVKKIDTVRLLLRKLASLHINRIAPVYAVAYGGGFRRMLGLILSRPPPDLYFSLLDQTIGFPAGGCACVADILVKAFAFLLHLSVLSPSSSRLLPDA